MFEAGEGYLAKSLLKPLLCWRLAERNLLAMHDPAMGELDRRNHGAVIATTCQ